MPVYKFKDKKGWFFKFMFEGKQYKREKYNGKPMLTKVEAQACEYEFRSKLQYELDNSKKDIKERVSVGTAFLEYIESKKQILKIASVLKFETFYRNDLTFKELLLSEVTVDTISKWKSTIAESNITTVSKNRKLALLNKFFEWCNICYDFSNKVRIPLQTKFKDNNPANEVTTYTLDQFNKFIATFDNIFWIALFRVLFFTGIRIGELSALQIDSYSKGTLTIDKDVIRVNGEYILQTPKTKNSYRTITLDEETDKMVSKLVCDRKKGYLFGDNKAPVSQQVMRKVCLAHSRMADLPKIKIHEFRKSHATYLKDLGFNVYAIASRLGNTPEISNEVYIQSRSTDQVEIAEKLSKISKK